MRYWGWTYKHMRGGFLLHEILGIILSLFYIGLLVYLVVENRLDLGWGIFFLSYFIFVLILELKWDTGILLIKKRFAYWMKIRDDADLFKKLKDPQKFKFWKKFYQRRIIVVFLYLFYLLAWGIWGFLAYNQWEVLLFSIIFVAIMAVVAYLAYPDILRK
jgi:hypothetical protein